jgi:two-component system OmpR family response regulator
MSVDNSALIVLVEDDEEIRRLVADMLSREGFTVEPASSGEALDQVLARQVPDLVILDLMLPGEDGLAICRRLRSGGGVPILMLTAKADPIDRVVGLEMGADDYLAKPFNPRELLARIRAILRRAEDRPAAPPSGEAEVALVFDGWTIQPGRRQLLDPSGRAVELTGGEFDLLVALAERPQRVLSRDRLLDLTKGRAASLFDRSVDVQIGRLRRKLENASAGAGALIATVRGGGYMLTAAVTRSDGASSTLARPAAKG